jgi:hypothetical protein
VSTLAPKVGKCSSCCIRVCTVPQAACEGPWTDLPISSALPYPNICSTLALHWVTRPKSCKLAAGAWWSRRV